MRAYRIGKAYTVNGAVRYYPEEIPPETPLFRTVEETEAWITEQETEEEGR